MHNRILFASFCTLDCSVVLRRSKLPMSLINDGNVGGKKEALAAGGALPKLSGEALLAIEPFEGVFGSKKTRKRPRLQAADLATLALQVGSCLCLQLKYSGLQHFEPAENSLCGCGARCMQAEEKEAAFQKSISAGDVPANGAGEGGPVELIFQKGTSRRIWGVRQPTRFEAQIAIV